MRSQTRWLLPAGIQEVLPKEAAELESYRRKALDLFASWGYQLVIPPFIEFLDSLLVGECEDLDLQTFKLTDQLSGRMMGVRADMTPQVARIDAHMIKGDAPQRLCYCGTVLHTRPESAGGTRSPLQTGAELYGHSGLASDVEIITLMTSSLQAVGIEQLVLDLGHTGIYEALVSQANLPESRQDELFNMLQRKSSPDIIELFASTECSPDIKQAIVSLVNMHGSAEVLARARQQLAAGGKAVADCIDYIERVANNLGKNLNNTSVHFDLAESRGYHYQKGIVFTAFCANNGIELARGGRYNNIGESFGRARPAIGFSADLRQLITASTQTSDPQQVDTIYAPAVEDVTLLTAVEQLRNNGNTVISSLTDSNSADIMQEAASMGCTKILYKKNNKWEIKNV